MKIMVGAMVIAAGIISTYGIYSPTDLATKIMCAIMTVILVIIGITSLISGLRNLNNRESLLGKD